MGYTTKALHAPYPVKDPHGALRQPIYQNAAYEFDTAATMEDVFQGRITGHTYTRATNPTVTELENKVRHITDAFGVIATASGIAAISDSILALTAIGDNIITTNKLFGHTYSLFASTLPRFGITAKFIDLTDIHAIEEAIDSKTRAILFETISNPGLIIPNIEAIVALANKYNLVVIADTTMTPFNMFDAKKAGIHVEVVSATKALSGGGTTIGGLILDNGLYDWSLNPCLHDLHKELKEKTFIARLRRDVFRNLGATLPPQNAYMLSLGLETLALRVEKSAQNAQKVAKYLENEPAFSSVGFPGLSSSPYHALCQKQFSLPGSLISFDLESKEKAYAFMDHLKVIRRSTNIQDNKSLIIPPYHTIYAEFSETLRKEMGLRETQLRLSVGIEEVDDLIKDLKYALEAVK